MSLTLPFAGQDFKVVGGKALFWPAQRAIIVADLHLEKASWFAARGQMLPPHDSLATLEALGRLIGETGARRLWCLGDNFHDSQGPARLTQPARALLGQLAKALDWVWITGNHDAALAAGLTGTVQAEAEVAGLLLRHEADPKELRPEVSGHFHPKHGSIARGRRVTRPCFVEGPSKLILPSFGALTGGLAATDAVIRAALGDIRAIHVPTRDRLVRFAV
ncbi:MAG: ligase-associated DNA damage response endonuclease PdeM [Chakrabartia sp.]